VNVPNICAESLTTAIVENQKESFIFYSDRMHGCKPEDMEDMAFKHLKVNDKPYFVDKGTGLHTKIMEQIWE
jgi:hypothetical protein